MDKVVLITGASSGIGEATARMLAAKGAKVVLGARRRDRLAALEADIKNSGGQALAQELDVTDPGSVSAAVTAAIDTFGRIDVLVNNAGIMALSTMAERRVEEWNQMIDVNIKGVLHGIAAALPPMLAQGRGHVIIVGSIAGQEVNAVNAVYASTKFAVRAIAQGLRLEGGSAIRSTLIAPGAVQSELFEKIPHEGIRHGAMSRFDSALPADAIASAIAYAIDQPDHVDVSDIYVRPMTYR